MTKKTKLTKEEKEKKRKDKKLAKELKNNPNKGSLRDYPFIDLICNTWEGMIVYSLFFAVSLFFLLFKVNLDSWVTIYETTLCRVSWIISAVLFIPLLIGSIRYWAIWFGVLVFDKDIDTVPRVIFKIGVPRQGKSSTSFYEAVLCAKKMWSELKIKYAEYKFKIKKGEKLEGQAYLDWLEVKLSYEYCVMHDAVPLLWSNTPIKVDNRFSNILTYDHVAGKKKLPFKCVMVIDEVTRFLDEGKSMEHGQKKDWDVSNMFALEGHFLGSIIYIIAQDDNAFIDMVRTCLYTEVMNKQSPACKPGWLTSLVNFYKFIILEVNRKKPNSDFLLFYPFVFLHEFWKRIGFRKYNASRRSSRTGNNKLYSDINSNKKLIGKSRSRTFYLPAKLNCIYDDRTFRTLYPAYFNEKIEGDIWTALHLDVENSFLKSTQSAFDIALKKKKLQIEVKNAFLEENKKNKKNPA